MGSIEKSFREISAAGFFSSKSFKTPSASGDKDSLPKEIERIQKLDMPKEYIEWALSTADLSRKRILISTLKSIYLFAEIQSKNEPRATKNWFKRERLKGSNAVSIGSMAKMYSEVSKLLKFKKALADASESLEKTLNQLADDGQNKKLISSSEKLEEKIRTLTQEINDLEENLFIAIREIEALLGSGDIS